jgi:hypothetical protein
MDIHRLLGHRFDLFPLRALDSPPPAAPAVRPGTIFPDGVNRMPVMVQGQSNACGTTSLAMILSFLTGTTIDRHDIDHQIRRLDVFSSPRDLITYARQAGLPAEGYNHGSQEELTRFIDAGTPCQLLISADGSHDLSRLHMVVAVAHRPDPLTGGDLFLLHNPARGTVELPGPELERLWAGPAVGFDRYFIAVGRAGTTLPPGRQDGIRGTLTTAQGLADVMNAADRLIHPDHPGSPLADILAIERGAVQAIAGVLTGGLEQAVLDAAENAPPAPPSGWRRLLG